MNRILKRMLRPSPRLLASAMSLVLVFTSSAPAFAADRFWRGENSDVWELTGNWSASLKGAGGASVPGAADIAHFEGSGTTIQMRSRVTIDGLVLESTWTGSVLQGTGVVKVGNSGVKIGSGRFIGGNAAFSNSGSFTQTGGIVSGLQSTYATSGALTVHKGPSSAYAVFNSTGTLIFNGIVDQNFQIGTNVSRILRNITLNNNGGGTADEIITAVNGGLIMSGALTITLGNLDMTTNSKSSLFGTGALTVLQGITLANSAQATLTTDSDVTVSGTILVNDNATWTMTAATLTLNDNGEQSVDLDGQNFENFTINNTGGGTSDSVVINGGGLNLSGRLLVTAGNLDLSSFSQAMVVRSGVTLANSAQATITTDTDATVSGTILVNDLAAWGMTGGTLTLNANSDQNVDLDGQSFFNLTINNTKGGANDDIIIAGGSLNLSGALTVTRGNLDLDTNSLDLFVDGNVTIADNGQSSMSGANMEIGGNLTKNNAGTFNNSGGTVTFDGNNQTISGSISFYNLTKTVSTAATLKFSDTQTITVIQAMTLKGIASNLLSLRSTTSGTRWQVNPLGTKPVEYIDVKDSENLHTNDIQCHIGCANSGNNVKWSFARPTGDTTATTTSSSTSGGGGGSRRAAKVVSTITEKLEPITEVPTVALEPETGLPTVRDRLSMMLEGRTVVFKDVPVSEWFASFVARIIGKGIASGYKDARGNLTGEFGPGNHVTYAEIAKMALETAGESIENVGGPPMNRTARRQWSQDYVRRAEEMNLSVYEPRLDVNTPATRGAVVQTILEALGVPLDTEITDAYKDLHPRHPHSQALSTATRLGIISGDTDRRGNPKGTVRPNDPINRAETSKVLTKVLDAGL